MNNVLIVDDEPYVSEVLRHFLSKNGYQVHTAMNGEEATHAVMSLQPEVVITDIQMPRMGGQELYAWIRENAPDFAGLVVVMTSRTDRALRTWADELDDIVFLEKPLSPRTLIARLNNHFS